jgi:hypothetical protein
VLPVEEAKWRDEREERQRETNGEETERDERCGDRERERETERDERGGDRERRAN